MVTYPQDQLGALAPKSTHPHIFRRGYPERILVKRGFMVDGNWKTNEVNGRLLVSVLVWAGHGRTGRSRHKRTIGLLML